ncbi:MAG: hypothetical protein R2789_00060 [Microthrixaceae bacterium]
MAGPGAPPPGSGRRSGDGWVLERPCATGWGRSTVVGVHDGALKVKACRPPPRGEGQRELVRYSQGARHRQAPVRLVRGERSRVKTLEVAADITPLCEPAAGS